MDERLDGSGKERDERDHREVGDRRVDRVARSHRHQAAKRDADLLEDLALSSLPGRLARVDAAPREGDLSRMIPQVGPAPDEGNHPMSGLPIEDEHHRRLPGSFPKLAPAVDRLEQVGEPVEKRVRELAHGSR